jgi:hypothetical protein
VPSLTALLSLLGVSFFCLIVLCQKKGERILAKKAALGKKKDSKIKALGMVEGMILE